MRQAIRNLSCDQAAGVLKGWHDGLRGREPTGDERAIMNELEDKVAGILPYDPAQVADDDADI